MKKLSDKTKTVILKPFPEDACILQRSQRRGVTQRCNERECQVKNEVTQKRKERKGYVK